MKNLSLDKQLVLFINEAIDKRVPICMTFAVLSIIFILVGIYFPKVYGSKATILWTNYDPARAILQQRVSREEQRINIQDQVQIAKEIIFSNNNLDDLIKQAQLNVGEDGKRLSRRQIEVLKANIRSGLSIYNSGTRIIVIEYRHLNPEVAYLVVSIASELFIQETREVKNKTSKSAFDFINRQVIDYKNKLDLVNRRIIEFRKANADLDSDTRIGVNNRVNNLKTILRDTTLQLTEARVQKKSLQNQLAIERADIEQQLLSESRQASSAVRESAYAERLATLKANLDTLRLSYTESYPDIIQLKEQIKNLQEQIDLDNQNIQATETTGDDDSRFDINFSESPLYVQLAGEISDVETNIQTLLARKADTESRLDSELLRANKVNTQESQLEEMTRDLDVTQSIYDDLLTRRENARVSLNLQLENQGSTFKIQEPAMVPHTPVGLRFLHFVLGSMPLAFAVPFGILYMLLFLDSRIRHEDYIEESVMNIPVIGAIEHYSNINDKAIDKRKTIQSISIVFSALLIFSLLIILKINNYFGV